MDANKERDKKRELILEVSEELYFSLEKIAKNIKIDLNELITMVLNITAMHYLPIKNAITNNYHTVGVPESELFKITISELMNRSKLMHSLINNLLNKLGGLNGLLLEKVNWLENFKGLTFYFSMCKHITPWISKLYVEISNEGISCDISYEMPFDCISDSKATIQRLTEIIEEVKDSKAFLKLMSGVMGSYYGAYELEVIEKEDSFNIYFSVFSESIDDLPKLPAISRLFKKILKRAKIKFSSINVNE